MDEKNQISKNKVSKNKATYPHKVVAASGIVVGVLTLNLWLVLVCIVWIIFSVLDVSNTTKD